MSKKIAHQSVEMLEQAGIKRIYAGTGRETRKDLQLQIILKK